MSSVAEIARARSFGRSVGVVLVLIGAYQLWRGRTTLGEVMAVVGAMLAVLGKFAPAVIELPSRIWWRFSHMLGWINSRIILTLFFLLVLTPLGWFFKMIGRDPLMQRAKGSTWSPYPPRSRNHYEKQF